MEADVPHSWGILADKVIGLINVVFTVSPQHTQHKPPLSDSRELRSHRIERSY